MHAIDRLALPALLLFIAPAAGAGCGSVDVDTDSGGGPATSTGVTTSTETDTGSSSCDEPGTSTDECGQSMTAGTTATETEVPPDPPDLVGWWRHVGGEDSDDVHDVAVAPGGDVLVAGAFRGTVDFGAGPVTATLLEDAFVARYGSDGVLKWLRHIGSSASGVDNAKATGVAVDAGGNVLLTGLFEGAVDPGTGPLVSAGKDDIFVVRYSMDGNALWGRRIGGESFERVGKIAADGQGNALLAGTIAGQLFVAKLDVATGQDVWFHDLGGVHNGLSYWPPVSDVAADPAGDLYIAGSFSGAASLGGSTFQSAGGTDVFLARYRGSDGAHVWSQRFGGTAAPISGGDEASSLAVDGESVVICGYSWGPIDLGGGSLEAEEATWAAFLARYDTGDGGHVWSRRLDSASADRVAMHGDSVFVLGLIAPEDQTTVLLGRFALVDGAEDGLAPVPGSGELAIGADGRAALALGFYADITAGEQTFTAAGGSDLLIGPFLAASAAPF